MEKFTLPAEIKEQALKVSDKKQKEVLKVLTDIFNGTADWENQVDKIKIKDVNDKMSIALAETARKNAKEARLDGEKIFDAKRDTLKLKMSDDKLESDLWLKSKQIMQLKFKHIEEKAKFKSEFVKRYEIEQKELQTELRLSKVNKYNESIYAHDIEDLTDDIFNSYLEGQKANYERNIAAEKKAEELRLKALRLDIIESDRYDKAIEFKQFWEKEKYDFRGMCKDEFIAKIATFKNFKIAYEKVQEKIKLENERLKKEAEEKEKRRLADEKIRIAKEEKERKIREEKEKKDFERIRKIERDKREIKRKLEKELEARENEKEAEKQRLINEKIATHKAEKAARLAPDKEKLIILAKELQAFKLPVLKSDEANNILTNVTTALNKTYKYINDNLNKI